jgi:hypothetical protein
MLINKSSGDLVSVSAVLDDALNNLSDHLPVFVRLNVSLLCVPEPLYNSTAFKWKSTSLDYINLTYKNDMEQKLHERGRLNLHTAMEIDDYYTFIVHSLKETAIKNIPCSSFKTYLKPFWKKGLGPVHKVMLAARNVWVNCGRPRGRDAPSFNVYKQAKRRYSCSMKAKMNFMQN